MEERRWGLVPWLLTLCALWGAQAAAATTLWETSSVLAVAVVLLVQILKIPPTRWRINDLGLPPDDLVYLAPPMGIVLLPRLLGGTPSKEVWERKRRTWVGQVNALDAYSEGWRRLKASMPAVLGPTVLVAAAVAVAVEAAGAYAKGLVPDTAPSAMPAPGDGAAALEQGLMGTAALLGLYTLMQFNKRATASRASWWPSLALIPTLLMWAAVAFRGAAGQAGVLLASLPGEAANLLISPLGAGFLVPLWLVAATRKPDGAWPSGAEATGLARAKALDVGAVWGWRAQATWLGMQFLIPGVWVAVSWALADVAATLRAERPAFNTSTELVRGQRSRVFKVLTVWFLMSVFAVRTVLLLPFVGPDVIFNSLLVPEMLPPQAQAVASFGAWMTSWWCALAMMVVLEERERVLEARRQAAATGV